MTTQTQVRSTEEALKLALEALERVNAVNDDRYILAPSLADAVVNSITAIKEALAQPAQEQNLKLMPREATPEMLKAMDECSTEGYDERLYEGHAGSVYMAAWDAFHGQHCYCGDITSLGVIHRDDGPCHYPEHKEPEHEPVAIMPSNTRYTVEVEGRGQTYWDNIHDAITNAQRAVYSGPDNTTRALDDLKAGRIAEWSYGFSAVRIYPPQSATPPQRTWVGLTDEEILSWWSMDNGLEDLDMCNIVHFRKIIEAVEAKLKEKNT